MVDYDNEVGIGWGPFKDIGTRLFPEFMPCAAIHDEQYNWLIAGTSPFTLREIDRQFLKNCLYIASIQKDAGDKERLRREAYICYAICRAWAKIVRPELESYKPTKGSM